MFDRKLLLHFSLRGTNKSNSNKRNFSNTAICRYICAFGKDKTIDLSKIETQIDNYLKATARRIQQSEQARMGINVVLFGLILSFIKPVFIQTVHLISCFFWFNIVLFGLILNFIKPVKRFIRLKRLD